MDEKDTVLVVTPHPDDSESGAGGTIARWCAEGRKVVLVVCTNGDKGTSDRAIAPEELAVIRERETLAAAKVYGLADVVFLRFPDQGLEDSTEFREQLVRQIRIHRPGIVVAIEPGRRYIRHRDHYVAGRVTLDAVFPYARDHLAYPEHLAEGLEPHRVREVYLFRAEEPDTYVDVTDWFEIRTRALACHVSQVGEWNEERDARSRARYAEIGARIGVEFAEQFKRIEIWR
ncbi:MAG: PIG-L deacetylase family protein [Dehalococcoidia bacterium]